MQSDLDVVIDVTDLAGSFITRQNTWGNITILPKI